MEKQSVMVAPGLTVSFSSEVLARTAYVPCGSSCGSCSGGCSEPSQEASRALVVHQIPDEVLQCQSSQGLRTLQARYVITDSDGQSEQTALRAFKDSSELLSWVESLGQDLPDVRASLASSLSVLS
jgi:hypothetical protein